MAYLKAPSGNSHREDKKYHDNPHDSRRPVDIRDGYFRIHVSGDVILVGKYKEKDMLGDLSIDKGDELNLNYLHLYKKLVASSCEHGIKLLFTLRS